MTDREEQIDQWIFESGVKKASQRERRKKIIPSSTDSITHTPLGDPLDAMDKVACYFGDHPELPIVEMGRIEEDIIGLTFGDPVHLEFPFQLEGEEDGSHWTISHSDALALSTGGTYGWQTAALTAIGNSPTGSKMLLNTNRWHVLGLAGLDQFISSVMIGQVMEQATEPWTAEHHIWLVGYRELGPKLVNFLTTYHDESYFHLVETVEQITAEDIAGTSATLYVKNSNAATLQAFNRIRADHPNNVGMLTDTIVTEQAMYIGEDDDGGATILNAAPYGIKLWPNIVGEDHKLYGAMEVIWDKHQEEAEQARQAAESVTMADFLPAEPEDAPAPPQERTGSTSVSTISAEDLEDMFNSGTAVRETPLPAEAEEAAVAVAVAVAEIEVEEAYAEAAAAVDEAEIVGAEAQAIVTPAEPTTAPQPVDAPAEPEAPAEPATAQAPVDAPAEPEAPAEPATAPEPVQAPVEAPVEPATAQEPVQAPVTLLGQPTVQSAAGAVVEGKPAEAVVFLHLNGLSREGTEVSEALWPDADNMGGAARARRTRTAKAIREALPGSFRVEDQQWMIDPLTTDLDRILSTLTSDANPEDVAAACHAIQAPLQGCAAWADQSRAGIVQQLQEALEAVMDRALDHDQIEIVKAVRQATKKL